MLGLLKEATGGARGWGPEEALSFLLPSSLYTESYLEDSSFNCQVTSLLIKSSASPLPDSEPQVSTSAQCLRSCASPILVFVTCRLCYSGATIRLNSSRSGTVPLCCCFVQLFVVSAQGARCVWRVLGNWSLWMDGSLVTGFLSYMLQSPSLLIQTVPALCAVRFKDHLVPDSGCHYDQPDWGVASVVGRQGGGSRTRKGGEVGSRLAIWSFWWALGRAWAGPWLHTQQGSWAFGSPAGHSETFSLPLPQLSEKPRFYPMSLLC